MDKKITADQILTEADELLCGLEDYTHGEDGRIITKVRGNIQKAMEQLSAKPMQWIKATDRLPEDLNKPHYRDTRTNLPIGYRSVSIVEQGADRFFSFLNTPSDIVHVDMRHVEWLEELNSYQKAHECDTIGLNQGALPLTQVLELIRYCAVQQYAYVPGNNFEADIMNWQGIKTTEEEILTSFLNQLKDK